MFNCICRLKTNYEECTLESSFPKGRILDEMMQDHPGFKPPPKRKVGTIVQSLFPSVKSTTAWEHGKKVGAYKYIRRKQDKDGTRPVDMHSSLTDYGFIINKDENSFIQALCPTGVTLNSVELYKQMEIDNGKLKLKFAGKEINIFELTGIRQIDLTNKLELTTALESIKSLKPCTGVYLPNQSVKYYTWGRVGQQTEIEKESINCNRCSGLLPINTLNDTTICKPCLQHRSYKKIKIAEDLKVSLGCCTSVSLFPVIFTLEANHNKRQGLEWGVGGFV